MKKVYIAGPYTKGDVAENVSSAIEMGTIIADMGGAPFVPHLTHFWHMMHPRGWEFWMQQDEAWLRVCDAVLRLPGDSVGADREVELAEQLGLAVFTDHMALLDWMKKVS